MTAQPQRQHEQEAQALVREFSVFFENYGVRGTIAEVWTHLYLSPTPLGQRELIAVSGLSTGMVSTAVQQLEAWEAVKVTRIPGSRRLHYEAETNLLRVLRRILRERDIQAARRLHDAINLSLETYDPPVGKAKIQERLRAVAQATETYMNLFQAVERVARLPALVPAILQMLRRVDVLGHHAQSDV